MRYHQRYIIVFFIPLLVIDPVSADGFSAARSIICSDISIKTMFAFHTQALSPSALDGVHLLSHPPHRVTFGSLSRSIEAGDATETLVPSDASKEELTAWVIRRLDQLQKDPSMYLKRDEEYQWIKARNSGVDSALIEELGWRTAEPYVRLQVRKAISRYRVAHRGDIDIEDLMQEMWIRITQFAVRRFDPVAGSWLNYITTLIWSTLLRVTHEQFPIAVRLPDHKHRELGALRRARTRLRQQLERRPTVKELQEELDLPYDQLIQLMIVEASARSFSMGESFTEDSDSDTPADTLLINDKWNKNDLLRLSVQQEVRACLARLSLQEALILYLIQENWTVNEISHFFGGKNNIALLKEEAQGKIKQWIVENRTIRPETEGALETAAGFPNRHHSDQRWSSLFEWAETVPNFLEFVQENRYARDKLQKYINEFHGLNNQWPTVMQAIKSTKTEVSPPVVAQIIAISRLWHGDNNVQPPTLYTTADFHKRTGIPFSTLVDNAKKRRIPYVYFEDPGTFWFDGADEEKICCMLLQPEGYLAAPAAAELIGIPYATFMDAVDRGEVPGILRSTVGEKTFSYLRYPPAQIMLQLQALFFAPKGYFHAADAARKWSLPQDVFMASVKRGDIPDTLMETTTGGRIYHYVKDRSPEAVSNIRNVLILAKGSVLISVIAERLKIPYNTFLSAMKRRGLPGISDIKLGKKTYHYMPEPNEAQLADLLSRFKPTGEEIQREGLISLKEAYQTLHVGPKAVLEALYDISSPVKVARTYKGNRALIYLRRGELPLLEQWMHQRQEDIPRSTDVIQIAAASVFGDRWSALAILWEWVYGYPVIGFLVQSCVALFNGIKKPNSLYTAGLAGGLFLFLNPILGDTDWLWRIVMVSAWALMSGIFFGESHFKANEKEQDALKPLGVLFALSMLLPMLLAPLVSPEWLALGEFFVPGFLRGSFSRELALLNLGIPLHMVIHLLHLFYKRIIIQKAATIPTPMAHLSA